MRLPLSTFMMILAAAVFSSALYGAEEKQPPLQPETVLAEWDFTKADEEKGLVPNQIKDGPQMVFWKDAPALVEQGLRFDNGAGLVLRLTADQVPEFFDGKTPVQIDLVMIANRKPDGYNGPLFDGFYGFMSLSLIANDYIDAGAKGSFSLHSTEKIEFGKADDVTMQFFAGEVKLLVNGKAATPAPKLKYRIPNRADLPKDQPWTVYIGYSPWGEDRFFNGIIKYIKIRKLEPPPEPKNDESKPPTPQSTPEKSGSE